MAGRRFHLPFTLFKLTNTRHFFLLLPFFFSLHLLNILVFVQRKLPATHCNGKPTTLLATGYNSDFQLHLFFTTQISVQEAE